MAPFISASIECEGGMRVFFFFTKAQKGQTAKWTYLKHLEYLAKMNKKNPSYFRKKKIPQKKYFI